MKYVDIVVDNKSEYTDNFYTYSAPDDVCVGDKVSVSFARRKKPIDGYVFAIDTCPNCDPSKIKSILEIDRRRSLTAEMIETAEWMVTRYGVKAIDAVKMFTVGGKRERGGELKAAGPAEVPHELSEEQREAVARISAAIDGHHAHAFLLKGVTNSGKTEVYMQAVEHAISLGRTAIVLVPEIALCAQTEKRLKARFGKDSVAVMHSKLTTSRRLEEWLKLRDGRAKIAVGARTAVFAPLENIGIIVIDEEHESTYKSDHNPKYETVDVAFKRAKAHGAAVVLGSATPSIVSYSRAEEGIYELLEMNERIGGSELPDIEVVDMCLESRRGNLGLFSERLYLEMKECLSRGEQVILFLNRRGFSTQVVCAECGHRLTCGDCGITLTYHKKDNAAVCHYCGKKSPIPKTCPECGSKMLKYIGSGTEKVEERARELFPGFTVDRFDIDTAVSQKEIDRVIADFQEQRTAILVGTQILAKGLDFRNVGLVGIILADTSLNIPDYRSAERTFQLITQVAGRAGRNSAKSKVIIQTYVPDDETVKAAAAYDYEAFYRDEILHRKIMNYPPFSDLIAVSFIDKKDSGNDPSLTMEYAKSFRETLLGMKNAPSGATILPPRENALRMGSERNRVTFIIKAPKGTRPGYIKAYADRRDRMTAQKAPCYIEIDVNPYGII